jgi:hypothetical protein
MIEMFASRLEPLRLEVISNEYNQIHGIITTTGAFKYVLHTPK